MAGRWRQLKQAKSTYCRNKEFCNELTRCAKESCCNRVFLKNLILDELQFFLSLNLGGRRAISIDLLEMSGVRHDWNLIRV